MGGRGSKITPVKVATLSSCLADAHFRLFLHLKKHLASQKFHEDKEVKTKSLNVCTRSSRVPWHLNTKSHTQARLNKCFDKGGDC